MEGNMTTGHVFIAASLDGFVAREDHGLDWLNKQNTADEDHGYDDFVSGIDGLIMGSGSFKNTLNFGDWPYQKPVIVMSTSLTESNIPTNLNDKVRLTRLAPKELMAWLKEEGWTCAYVDGGQIVQSFIRARLIKDVTITIVPILIGEGRRLFGEIDGDIDFQLIGSEAFNSGLVQIRYEVI